MFPTPFRATFEREGERLPEADTVDYAFVPTYLDDERNSPRDGANSSSSTQPTPDVSP